MRESERREMHDGERYIRGYSNLVNLPCYPPLSWASVGEIDNTTVGSAVVGHVHSSPPENTFTLSPPGTTST